LFINFLENLSYLVALNLILDNTENEIQDKNLLLTALKGRPWA